MSASELWILSYGCSSATNNSSAKLWSALQFGQIPPSLRWPAPGAPLPAREIIARHLATSWQEALANVSPKTQKRLRESRALGVIFASTKGFIDDVVWSESPSLERDTLAPILDDFIRDAQLKPQRRTCVSNACTSGLSALFLARHWLTHGGLTDVIVISADCAGEFVQKGFTSLKVLTPDETRPFSGKRSGFKIGDAAACLILSKECESNSLCLSGVAIDGEGHAVTRPSQSGESLEAACRRLPLQARAPDLIIAHGTSTLINDATEDRVYARVFGDSAPLITGTKWCTGHTLGASSALDVIAACEVLKNDQAFSIATTSDVDSGFKNRYAVSGTNISGPFKRVMISSLGFGGIHAAALIEKPT